MFCGNCGKKNEEGAKFCKFCGSPMKDERGGQPGQDTPAAAETEIGGRQDRPEEQPVQEQTAKKKKKRRIWVLGAAVILIIALITAGILIFRERQEKQSYDNALASGNRYLEEMDYEKAEDSYLKAISIDPKQKEPYLRLVDTYVLMEEYDRAVETAEEAKEAVPTEDRQEFDDIILKWENVIEYTWVTEPEIEAENITFIQVGDSEDFSLNEREKQRDSDYAVIVRDGLLGLIRSDGTIAAETEYTSIIVFSDGKYLMTRNEPKYESSMNAEWTSYFFDEETGEVTIAEGLGGGFDLGGMYYYCGGLHNVNEAYTYLEDMGYRFSEPDTAIPVQRSDELFGGTGNYRDWLSGNYAVYNDGTLTTDFIYEECGSESGGLIAAKMDGKWGYITVDGTVIIPFEYDPSWQLYDGWGMKECCYAASEGFIPLVKDGVWEMRDTAGNVVIPGGVFDAICPVYNGKCWVQKDGKWGVVRVGPEISGPEEESEDATDDSGTEPKTEKSEEELRAILGESSSDQILSFEYDDYDGDGFSEAFAVTSPAGYDSQGSCTDAGVWYITSDGNCTRLREGAIVSGYQEKLTTGGREFLVLRISQDGSESMCYVFGVRDGETYEPQVSGQYNDFTTAKYDDYTYVGVKSDSRSTESKEFVFDSDSGEFVER